MERLKYSVTLTPNAAEALRRLVLGSVTTDDSPRLREILNAITEAGCSEDDQSIVLLVLGFSTHGGIVGGGANTPRPAPRRETSG